MATAGEEQGLELQRYRQSRRPTAPAKARRGVLLTWSSVPCLRQASRVRFAACGALDPCLNEASGARSASKPLVTFLEPLMNTETEQRNLIHIDELGGILASYKALNNLIDSGTDPDDIRQLMDDLNERFKTVLDRHA